MRMIVIGWPNYVYVSQNVAGTGWVLGRNPSFGNGGGGARGVNDAVSECSKFHLKKIKRENWESESDGWK